MPRFILSLILACSALLESAAQDATAIVRRAENHARGATSQAVITIQTVRPTWTREMSLKVWTKGDDFAMILLTAPAKDRGIVYLKRKKEVWNWIPSIERNIKLPPSMMSQSWMGTDFTNDDLVKESSIVADYTHTLAGVESVEGRLCHRIELVPKPDAAVVWGRVTLWIDQQDDLMMRALYYDEDGVLINTLQASDVKNLGGRLLPARLEMTPADKPGHKTVLLYTSLVFDKPIADDFFTVQNMERIK